jgi:phosphoribosylamine--glycine ligase
VITASPRVLVVGKDARTDAIALACRNSPMRPLVWALAELLSPGLDESCESVFTRPTLTDPGDVRTVAEAVKPDLVIIGPEEPLAAGYVDELRTLGLPVFGPGKDLARIESSKSWARELLDAHDIPGNPDYRVFTTAHDLGQYLQDLGAFVIKPDGLTAGKGVLVFGEHFQTMEDGLRFAEGLIAADGQVQIEEKLEGEEFSLQTITDGETVVHCPAVQDHKRAYAGDRGPNTGGMGSYSFPDLSLPFLTNEDLKEACSINERVIQALATETGQPYRGVLYGGFMATADGVRLIEYNSRFGDPEALNVLPTLQADFLEVCHAAALGELARVQVSFAPQATVCKYVVPKAYPDPTRDPGLIVVPQEYRDQPSLKWYWAACELDEDAVKLTSSRSGAVVGIADTVEQAEAIAEGAARNVEETSPVRHRADIGRDDVIAKRIRHMRDLRAKVRNLRPAAA